MALDKEIAQDIIDDFVLSNEVEFETIEAENPALFDATLFALNFLSSRFGTGQKMQIVEKPKIVQEVVQGGLPFKNGDKFKVPEEKSEQTYTLKDINLKDDQVMVSWYSISDKVDKAYFDSIKDVTKRINDGNWVLLKEIDLQVGNILFDVNDEELLLVTDVTSNNQVRLETVEGKRKFLLDKDVWVSKINRGEFIKPNFKVGDEFFDKNNNTFLIQGLADVLNNKTRVGIYGNVTGTITYNWNDVDAKVINGEWFKKEETTNNPNEIKIGDLIYSKINDKVYEILDVNQNGVKLMTSNNTKLSGSLGILNQKIQDGENVKLAFSIGDTFVNPEGDIYKIMELYRNNEKSLYVKVNEKANLDIFQWDILEDFVSDGYWVRGTKADADKIKANLSQAKPNATQAMMAKATATPTKTPKKRLTKLEKEIKDLQEEIDGLLFLADEDEEAKADLEKKLIQIEALKTKKP
jgi:hypothetical protein